MYWKLVNYVRNAVGFFWTWYVMCQLAVWKPPKKS